MSDLLALAVGLAGEAPEEAADVLSGLEPEAITAFLTALPEDQGPDVLAELPSPLAASCLETLAPEQSALWLQDIGYPFKTRIARALSSDTLSKVLAAMPKSSARQISRDIAYVPDSVGAWMEDTVGILSEEEAVGDCLARLRRQRRPLESTLIVTGKGRRYVGLLPLGHFLKASDKKTVGALADRTIAALDPDSPLNEAAGRPEWHAHLLLPVAGPRDGFLGVLRRERLLSALEQDIGWEAVPGSGLVGHLLEAALVSTAGMSQLLPSAEEVGGSEGEGEE